MENCEKAYSRPCLLEQHIRSHKDERPYLCTVPGCNKAFLRDSHLKTHLLSHSVEKPLYCSFCGKGFNTNQHLNRHERTHVPSVRCTFQGCDAAFRRSSQLRKHVSEFHTFRKEHVCPYCPREFDLRSRLEAHIKKAHSQMPSYHCGNDGCAENFSSWQELQSHIKSSHKTITCFCGQKFSSDVILSEHMKTAHPNPSNGLLSSVSNQLGVYQDRYTREWHCCEPQCISMSSPVFQDKDSLICHYQQYHGFVPDALQVQVLTPGSNSEGLPSLPSIGAGTDHGVSQVQVQNNPYLNLQSQGIQQQLPKRREPLTGHSSLIERITGAGYDSNRRIMCPIPDCCYRFAREYDLRRHVKAKHPHIITESGRLIIDYISIPAMPPQSELPSTSNSPSPVSFQPPIKVESLGVKGEPLDDQSYETQTTLPPLPNFSNGLSASSNQIGSGTSSHTHSIQSHSPLQHHPSQSSTPSNSNHVGGVDVLSHNQGSLETFFSNEILNGGSNMSQLHLHLSNELLGESSNQYSNITRSGNHSFNYPQTQKIGKSRMTSYPMHNMNTSNQSATMRSIHSVSSPTHSSVNSQAPSLHPSRSNTPVYSSHSHIYPVNTVSSSISTPIGSSPHQSYASRQSSPQPFNQSLSHGHQSHILNPVGKSYPTVDRNRSPRNVNSENSQEIDPMILNGSI